MPHEIHTVQTIRDDLHGLLTNGAATDPHVRQVITEAVDQLNHLAAQSDGPEHKGSPFPALPESANPNARWRLAISMCRECPEHSGWLRTVTDRATLYAWNDTHAARTGHRRFYMWRLTRNQAEIHDTPAALDKIVSEHEVTIGAAGRETIREPHAGQRPASTEETTT